MSLSASKDRAGIIHQILQQMLQKTFPWKTTFPPTTVWSFTPILIVVPKSILKSQLSPPDPPESVWHSGADHSGKSLLLVGGEMVLRRPAHLQIQSLISINITVINIIRPSLFNHTLTPNWPKPRPYRAREVRISETKTVQTRFIGWKQIRVFIQSKLLLLHPKESPYLDCPLGSS